MSEEPKPCPWCGGKAEPDCYSNWDKCFVYCKSCRMAGPLVDESEDDLLQDKSSADGAIAAWNRLAVLQEGEVVVPEEPTASMQIAAGREDLNNPQAFISTGEEDGVKVASHDQVYRAMLAARPKGASQ